MNKINRKIYCIWFGDKMTPNRKKCFDSIKQNSKVQVELITEDNLEDYILDDVPLHPSFNLLSGVHKSDYLRPYLMHYHGGGYTDIKTCEYDWNPYFDKLENSDKSFMSYSEKNAGGVAGTLEMKKHFNKLGGCCHYIFKPKSEITKIWIEKMHEVLDRKSDMLKRFPGKHSRKPSIGSKYPIIWTEINGTIFHKLQYDRKFTDGILNMPFVNTKNYL